MTIKKVDIVRLLILYLSISGPLIVLLYSLIPGGAWYLLKDGAIVFVALLSPIVFATSYNMRILSITLPIAAVAGYAYVVSEADLFAKLASIRQFAMPFVLLIIGYVYTKGRDDYERLQRAFIAIVWIILLFGFFERFLLIWQYVDVSGFFEAKKIPVMDNGYPFFWTEPISIFGYKDFDKGVVRMVSVIFDPINLGHILVLAFALMWYERGLLAISATIRWIFLFLISVALVLTFSKGAWLQLALVMVLMNGRLSNLFKLLFLIVAFPVIYIYITMHPGFLVHFYGLVSVFDYLTPLGHGLASFGNYAAMYNESFVETGVGDSFWGSLLGQFGVVGFLVWLFPFVRYSVEVGINHYLSRVLLAQVLVAALSENTFNLMAVAFLMMLFGSYLRVVRSERAGGGEPHTDKVRCRIQQGAFRVVTFP